MLTGTLSALLLLCGLFLVTYIVEPDNPPEKRFTSGAFLKATVVEEMEMVEVSITYHLNKLPGAKQLTYAGLQAFDTDIQNARALFKENQIELSPELQGLRIGGKIDLPVALIQDSTITFDLKYELTSTQPENHERFDVPIPLLWIENAHSISTRNFFNAHLVVPEKYFIQESFPGNVAPCYSNGDTRHNCANLHVLPTFIRVRGVIGRNPAFTPLKILDYGILFILTATCIFFGFLLVKKTL